MDLPILLLDPWILSAPYQTNPELPKLYYIDVLLPLFSLYRVPTKIKHQLICFHPYFSYTESRCSFMPIHQGTAFDRLFRIVFFRCFAPIVVTAHQTAAEICGFFRRHNHCGLATDRQTYKPLLIRLQPSDILSKPNTLSLMRKFLDHTPHNNSL